MTITPCVAATGAADAVDRDLDHRAAVRDQHHLVAVAHDPRAGESPLALDQLHRLHAHRPAALDRVVADTRALAVAVLGDDEEVGVVVGDVELDDLVAAPKLHACDARRVAPHRARLLPVEPNRLSHAARP